MLLLGAQTTHPGVFRLLSFSGLIVYKLLDSLFGIRLEADEEMKGSDLTIHKLESYPEDATSRFG